MTYTIQVTKDQLSIINLALRVYKVARPEDFEDGESGHYLADISHPSKNEPDEPGKPMLNGWAL